MSIILQKNKILEGHIKIHGSIFIFHPSIFRALVYSESWHIQIQRHIQNPLVYPKLWHIHNQRHIQNPGLFRTPGYLELEAY